MKVPKRRRREGKTDYRARIALLKSGKPRVVVRKTNRYIIAQLVKSKEAQDSVAIGVTSKHLLKYGWPQELSGSLKSIPASYLTGYLLGKKMLKINESKAILDIGLARSTKGSRLYAVVKGLLDAGIEIPCSEKVLPSQDRINGEHMEKFNADILKKVKANIDKEN